MAETQNAIRVVPAHYATAKAWEWLRHGDGMRLTPEKHDRITQLLLDMDELLHELDRETSNQDDVPASRRGAEVTRFAALMERELSANAYKDSHQLSHDFDHLIEQLREHVKKFAADPTDEYAADVANLAMLSRAAAKIDRLQRAASSPAVESSDV